MFLTVEARYKVPMENHEPTRSHDMSCTLALATGNATIQALTQERDELQGKVETLTEEKNN